MNFQTSKKHFSYSTDEELGKVVVVDIIEDTEEINYTKGTISLHDSSECCSHNNHLNQQKENMQALFETMKHKQDDSFTTSNHHETNDNNNNITGENIEMTDASTTDLNKVSIPSPTRNISSICEENCEKHTSPHQQPDITTPPSALSNNQQYEKQSIGQLEETLVEPIHIEAFSIQPCYSRTRIKSPQATEGMNPKHNNNNEIRLEPPQRKFHHPLSISNSTNSSTNTTMSSIEEEEDEEAFSVYTLDGSLSNLNQDSSKHFIIFDGEHNQTNTSAIDFNSALNLLQSIRDEQSKTQTLKPHQHSNNQILLRNFNRKIMKTITNHSKLETIQQAEEKNSKTTSKENHSPSSIAAVTMKILNLAAFALLDISFVIGAALFVAGCVLLIADNVNYFFSGILLFIIGSVLFLIGPLGKALVDIINLIRHFRWERKVKEITNLQNNSSKSLTDQMHELHQDVTSYRPSDLPALKMIILELVNDFFLIVGGLTFTIGSSLYMLNPPILIVIIAEVNWSVGAVSYLIVSIIQYIVKQVDIIKSARNGMDINPKCFTFMSIDLSAYLLNITSSLLFTIGSGLFLVNQRSLEITGEVIWSLGCVAMIIAVVCNRIIWIKSTWFERNDTLLTP